MVRPKLSRALLDELAVRGKLGISERNRRAKGFQGAKRARAELDRRERFKRQRGTGWDDLTLDLINLILAHISLLDLYHLRLSGLGSVSVSRSLHLKRAMRARVDGLRSICWYNMMAMEARRYTPTQFSQRTSLNLSMANCDTLRAVGRDMPTVMHLDAGAFGIGGLTSVPTELARCTRMETLSLQGNEFTVVPDVVLRLSALRSLLLNGNTRLDALPDHIGVRLARLRTIGLLRTKVKVLPRSLLETLERNLSRKRRASAALLVARSMFADGYLEETVTRDKFPKLADNLRRNLLDNHIVELPVDWD